MKFKGKDVVVAFIVDYSIPRYLPGNFYVYEIQGLFSGWTLEVGSLEDRHQTVALWLSELKKMHASSFLIDLPIGLNDNKVAQRALLSADPSTTNYNPKFLIIGRVNTRLSKLVLVNEIMAFVTKHKRVVFKRHGAKGLGNTFVNSNTDRNPQKVREIILDHFSENEGFVVEQVIENEYCPGLIGHYRSMVFQNTETGRTSFFDVYERATPKHTTDCHDSSTVGKGCLQNMNIVTAEIKQLEQSRRYQGFRHKPTYFKNIANSIFMHVVRSSDAIYKNESHLEIGCSKGENEKRLVRFIVKFHDADIQRYFSFFIRPIK
jgi:hypothetical protein